MNSWTLIFLGGQVGTDLLIVGAFPTIDEAEAFAISTGAPFNYQACQVWGPAVPPPMGSLVPSQVVDGSWLAITSGVSGNGNVRPVAYGNWNGKEAAMTWAKTQDNPAAYSFGQVQLTA